MLGGDDPGSLAGDPAIAQLREQPIPVLSAAGSATAARRAAAAGVGLVFDSLTTPTRCRELVDEYHGAGGTSPCVLIRRAWVGDPPVQQTAQQLDTYRSYAPGGAAAQLGCRRDGGRAPIRRPSPLASSTRQPWPASTR